ncbi:EfeM/EfeO family lipoprotein [Nocardioides anomalus]|uniref:EfeM/EfeO family lipoprotein n=1 Tax=Nocardioides anomalus TaxID=2712223 RepID=A0A6G6WC29_9ACTN|nr:EfeM/EfeO family lipoprotein [Nocardioides anomalus]QIG42901.1 EfeM/EfeO family lipoprotein [Nocardioides anomalus]
MAPTRRRRLVVTSLVLAVAATSATVVAAVTTGEHRPAAAESGAEPGAAPAAVDVSLTDCGSTWMPGPAGEQELTLRNADLRSGEVRVLGVDAAHREQVFAEVEPLGPGTTVTVHVRLAAGQYALQCLFEEQSPVTGPARELTGPGAGVRGVVPVPQDQLIRATLRYTRTVRSRLPAIEQQTRALAAAVARGHVAAARRSWLEAHAGYARLGAAYGAFGDLDGVLDGVPDGLFHRVERVLWDPAGSPRGAATEALADALADAVHRLRAELAGAQLDPVEFTVRAHEIAENLLRPVLTGDADFGSHSDLRTVAAGLDGTRTVLSLVREPLASRYPHLSRLFRELRQARRLVARLASGPMGSTAIADWPTAQRQRVDAVVAELAEHLASVATVLEPRRVT